MLCGSWVEGRFTPHINPAPPPLSSHSTSLARLSKEASHIHQQRLQAWTESCQAEDVPKSVHLSLQSLFDMPSLLRETRLLCKEGRAIREGSTLIITTGPQGQVMVQGGCLCVWIEVTWLATWVRWQRVRCHFLPTACCWL